ncbi:GPI-linked NAD(P)(+)--arginine ADP-ribosyltransferase 1-like [Betta splendens]|uniref:NAD(P)(+)--arginine ADP-ribosyltransferase n=1 Tax=Betta splendens TaxID=158456 RepID=A0A6P7MBS6_BETSP|nr:GPI-linked NAD(P)(+)--arginine ADP-ribosyltransferase 1-like [Betta splendens]XP_055367234.1 GPI-linked NAD(P)(+)--arginine ADP-ribosyltransferase 1-like [Betta splendens]XP_055367235.1 GPI-linked NAD(P)(+)--arginine ADP-ribosyltransferase 1-like [Betta splendens]XP_055367237.1 GPI-linked NAD(P)(+)--arginine ADP-ribosyltransferase 1-like [Betta splendens]
MKFRPVCGRCAGLCALLVVAALLWFYDPFTEERRPQDPAESPLDMAPDSIDDMYDGCRPEAASVIDLFGVFEWHYNRNFSGAWALAEKQAKQPAHEQLGGDHAVALYLYTGTQPLREQFNRAVKTGKRKYSTSLFTFHYFYFFLTDAIRVLRGNQTSCSVAYHRTWERFSPVPVDARLRFGAFVMAGATRQSFDFHGNTSCFEIRTCFGADITHYSAADQTGQLLIPPYEVFRVTDVRTDDWCSVVYKLQSTQTPRADLNCELRSQRIKAFFRMVPPHRPVGSLVKMLACVIMLLIISLVLVKQKQKGFVAVVLGSLTLIITVGIWTRNQSISEE